MLTYALEQIARRSYYETDQQQLFEGAVKGMVGRLNDDYSEYIPPKGVEDFNDRFVKNLGFPAVETAEQT